MIRPSGTSRAAAALTCTLVCTLVGLAGCEGAADGTEGSAATAGADTAATADAPAPDAAPEMGTESGAEEDGREPVTLPVSARGQLTQGMLTMLASLETATRAIATGDPAEAARAAAESGMGSAGMIPQEVRQRAPAGFLSLGMRTHQAFDALSRRAAAGAPTDSLLDASAAVLEACSECHATYRVEWQGPR